MPTNYSVTSYQGHKKSWITYIILNFFENIIHLSIYISLISLNYIIRRILLPHIGESTSDNSESLRFLFCGNANLSTGLCSWRPMFLLTILSTIMLRQTSFYNVAFSWSNNSHQFTVISIVQDYSMGEILCIHNV